MKGRQWWMCRGGPLVVHGLVSLVNHGWYITMLIDPLDSFDRHLLSRHQRSQNKLVSSENDNGVMGVYSLHIVHSLSGSHMTKPQLHYHIMQVNTCKISPEDDKIPITPGGRVLREDEIEVSQPNISAMPLNSGLLSFFPFAFTSTVVYFSCIADLSFFASGFGSFPCS